MGMSFLRGLNSMRAAMLGNGGVPGLRETLSSKDCSMQLENLFLNSGVREMLERNEYCAVYIIFSIIGSCIDHATRYQNDANMTGV